MLGDSFVHASTPPLWHEMSGATKNEKLHKMSNRQKLFKQFFKSCDDVFLVLYVSLCGGKFAAIIIMMHILVNVSLLLLK